MVHFKAQGTILSNVACHNERKVKAERLGVDISEVPLSYGSLRLGVNLLELDNPYQYDEWPNATRIYEIDRSSEEEDVKEVRLILEISYKFNSDGTIIEEHDIINDMTVGERVELTMTDAFVAKNHHLKYIPTKDGKTIKSYFIKAYADQIHFLNSCEMDLPEGSITPREVVQGMCKDKQLVIA